jgi:hypothetical protein
MGQFFKELACQVGVGKYLALYFEIHPWQD